MIEISLHPGEVFLATALSAERTRVNSERRVRDAKMGPQSYGDTEVLGLKAELAFCRYYNICPDLTTHARCGGHDAHMEYNGRLYSFDIKATNRPGGMLLATVKKAQEPADAYILAVVRDDIVRLIGWALGRDLFVPERITDLGYGPTYAMTQSQLYPLSRRSLMLCAGNETVPK